ncbi:MAG TPA: MdtA/MuxA family multidrug efflux RND transporter periplasmic adaptor subunit [Tepidisphaeraceae bacterium]|jgi:multidrug efflux system membrane fusion protein
METRSDQFSLQVAGREPAVGKPPEVTPSRRRAWPWVVLLLLLGGAAVGGYWFWSASQRRASAAAAAQTAQVRSVPVVAVPARLGDLDLYVEGIGSASAFNTVTVRSRVDGQLVKIAYTEGQRVNQGDLLAEIDPRPFEAALAQAQGQLAKDQAMLHNAQLDLERFTNASETVTKQQIDTQAALVQQDEGTVKTDEAAVQNAQLQLSYCRITAPIAGQTGLRLLDVGNMVHATDVGGLVVLTQLQPIAVLFSIPQDDLPQVLQKTTAGKKLTVEALDRDLKNRLATGTLLAIDNQVDPTTGTVRLKAEFDNKDYALFPNEFVNARLTVETLHDVVLVPSAAVQRGPSSNFVYVVRPDQTVEIRTVTLGASEGERTVIEGDVAAGEVVVTDGVDKLQQGSRVSVSAPGATTRSSRSAASRPASKPATSTAP